MLATKFHARMDDDDPNAAGSSRRHVIDACHESLRRLRTDHLDIYYIHRPTSQVPIDETLGRARRPRPRGQDSLYRHK